MVLLAQTNSSLFLTMPFVMFRILKPSLNARFTVCQWQGSNDGSQNIAAAKGIASMMQIGFGFTSSNCYNRFSLIAVGQTHSAKLKLTSFQA